MSRYPFNENALKFGPWSASKLNDASSCGLKFHWKYVEKQKEPEIGRSEGRIGNAAHKTVELVLQGQDMKRAFTVAAVDTKLTTNEIEDLMTYQGTIKDFLKRIKTFQQKQKVQKTLIEHQFGLTVDLNPTGFFGKDVFFRGAWDMGLTMPDNSLVILDHKTSKPPEKNPDTGKLEVTQEKFTTQLNIYAVSGRRCFPGTPEVHSAIHYMRSGDIVWLPSIKAQEIDDRLIVWFVDYLNNSVKNLVKEPTPGSHCDFCGFAPRCPAMKNP